MMTLIGVSCSYLAVGLIVAASVEEHVGSRTAVALGVLWPITAAALLLKSLGVWRIHTPVDPAMPPCGADCACLLTREDNAEYSVRLVDSNGPGDELGRLIIDPVTGYWAAIPTGATKPILGIYPRGWEAIEALLKQGQR